MMPPKRARSAASLVSLMPVGPNPIPVPPLNAVGGVVVMDPGGDMVVVVDAGVVDVIELALDQERTATMSMSK